jgi:hypothetical protein
VITTPTTKTPHKMGAGTFKEIIMASCMRLMAVDSSISENSVHNI